MRDWLAIRDPRAMRARDGAPVAALSSDVVELARELMAVLPEPLERLMRLAIQRFRDELMEALRSSDSVLDAALAG